MISQSGENETEGGRLGGRMRVGDAVDDEWLVVYLLREVSKRWPELIIGYVSILLGYRTELIQCATCMQRQRV